jgi:hypothetical protein
MRHRECNTVNGQWPHPAWRTGRLTFGLTTEAGQWSAPLPRPRGSEGGAGAQGPDWVSGSGPTRLIVTWLWFPCMPIRQLRPVRRRSSLARVHAHLRSRSHVGQAHGCHALSDRSGARCHRDRNRLGAQTRGRRRGGDTSRHSETGGTRGTRGSRSKCAAMGCLAGCQTAELPAGQHDAAAVPGAFPQTAGAAAVQDRSQPAR